MDEPPNRFINKMTKNKHTKLLEVYENEGFQKRCFDPPQNKRCK